MDFPQKNANLRQYRICRSNTFRISLVFQHTKHRDRGITTTVDRSHQQRMRQKHRHAKSPLWAICRKLQSHVGYRAVSSTLFSISFFDIAFIPTHRVLHHALAAQHTTLQDEGRTMQIPPHALRLHIDVRAYFCHSHRLWTLDDGVVLLPNAPAADNV